MVILILDNVFWIMPDFGDIGKTAGVGFKNFGGNINNVGIVDGINPISGINGGQGENINNIFGKVASTKLLDDKGLADSVKSLACCTSQELFGAGKPFAQVPTYLPNVQKTMTLINGS